MTLNEYKDRRAAMMDEANAFIDGGLIDEANERMAAVEKLDDEWESIRTAAANARALEGSAPVQNVSDPGAKVPIESIDKMKEEKNMSFTNVHEAYKSKVYENAWTKTLIGENLTAEEMDAYNLVNAYVHTTDNTAAVVPENIADGIWSEVEDMYPYYNDVMKTHVKGLLTVIQSDTTTNAGFYAEGTETEQGKETFKTLTLAGCELVRAITVSWKLKEMAVEDFIPYLIRRLAERMGAGAGYGVVNGAGPGGDNPEPTGVVTAIKADTTGAHMVTYTAGSLAYSDFTKARGQIKSGYANGLKVYANAATIWGEIANVKDDNGRPIFCPDPSNTGDYRVLGMTVEEDSSFVDGDILISNAERGYQANVPHEVSLATEDHALARTTDYVSYAIIDGAPLTLNAHSLLTTSAAATAAAKSSK